MKIKPALKFLTTLKRAKEPFGFLIGLILETIISIFIPIPFVNSVVKNYRTQILWAIGGSIFLILIGFISLLVILFYPIKILNSPFLGSAKIIPSNALVQKLNGYIEVGFTESDIPLKNPFGGIGMLNTYTTVNFHESENLIINGQPYNGIEQGIDIVPDGLYYLTVDAAKQTGQPVIFDTLNGIANTYTDSYGANYIVVTNKENTISTVYIHLNQFLISDNTIVHPGEPIGIMGSTGLSTGPHLEYQVRLNKNGSWVNVDPINYIH